MKQTRRPRGLKVVDLKGHTFVPGLIDAHDHIVLVGNRPGWHVLLEDVFTLQDVVKRYQAKAAGIPPGEFITTAGTAPDAGIQKAECVRGAELLRRPGHHDPSRQRRVSL